MNGGFLMNIKKIGKLLVTGILAGALAVTAGCGSKEKSANQAGDGGKKVITVAHTNYYVPYDFVNEKEESDGFEVAVMKEVAKKLPQYDFKFVHTSDDDLLIGVESGKYTVGTNGIWITEPRKKKYIFPKNNIGASVIGLIVRKENTDKIKDLASFADDYDKAIEELRQEGKIAELEQQYFGESLSDYLK